uniref:Autotransporter domain-containing protein n=1 Tax=Phenylobacterium glaciei TaxID=2803784 RepID=A0A974S8U5_9CAUL|nr:hypothetical protein JKL49_25200 [Phenylobacterium glaciei]
MGGAIQGGAKGGAGIFLSGGADNHLTIGGGVVSAKSYLAILGSDGDDAVDNSGRVIGEIGLGGGANSFTNRAAGVVESARVIALNGGTFANAGVVSPNGTGVLATTALLGPSPKAPPAPCRSTPVTRPGPPTASTSRGPRPWPARCCLSPTTCWT